MKQLFSAEKKAAALPFNKAAYLLYLVLAIYQAANGSYDWGVTNLGIALVFDPFEPTPWQHRTKIQRAILLLHLILLFAGAAWLFFR